MPNLRWDGNDFRRSKDSSGSTADLVSHSGKLQQGYRHGSLTRGLVAYYPMEKGEGEVLHDGALNNLGQINGASWNESAQIGTQSLNFDASSVDKVNANELDRFIEAPLSISFWIKPESMGDQVIFDHDGRLTISTGTPPTGTTGNDEIGFGIYDGSSWNNILTSSKSSGSWYHIVSLYDGTDMRLYVNGSKIGTNTSSKLATKNEGTELGARGTTDPYDGLIDDFRVYNRILSQPEIQALYNLSKPSGIEKTESKVPSQDQGGISRYKFDGDVTDSWENNDGTNNGVTFTDGVHGQAGSFNGSDDWIDTADNDYSYISAFVWVKTSTGGGHILNKDNWHDSERSWAISANDGYQKAYVSVGGTNYEANFPAFQDGNWHHIGFTYNGNKLILYEDGSQVNSNNSPSGKIDTSNLTIKIGAYGNTPNADNYYDGLLDDVRIYNSALTPQQVEQLYNLGAYRIPRRSTLQ